MKNACRASSALLAVGLFGACDAQVSPGYEGEPLTTLKGRVSALTTAPREADVGVLWLADSEAECSGPVPSCSYSSTINISATNSTSAASACVDSCGSMPDCVEVDAIERWESCQRACGQEIQVVSRVEYHACASGAVGQTAPVAGNFPAQFSLDVLRPPPSEALLRSDTGERIALGWFVALVPNSGPLRVDRHDDRAPAWLLGGSETHVLVYAADPIASDSLWGTYLGGEYSVGYHLVRVVLGTRCGLPRLEADEDVMVAPTTAAATSEAPPVETPVGVSYAGVPLVCGNGVCDPAENCTLCSDCIGCSETSFGTSSGRTNVDGGYRCLSTPSTLQPAAVGEADIELLIAPVDRIEWPSL